MFHGTESYPKRSGALSKLRSSVGPTVGWLKISEKNSLSFHMIFVGSSKSTKHTYIAGWWQLPFFFPNYHSYLGKVFTHFDLRIFFKGVGEKPPSSWHIGR